MQQTPLPRLELVPVRNLILHEDVENHRVARIMARLEKDGALRNPPLVGRNQHHRTLIVLDGASRVTAARRLGFPHLLVQVVPYPSAEIGLDRWHHLVVGMDFGDLVQRASRISGAMVAPMAWREASRALERRTILACLRSPGERPVALRWEKGAPGGIRSLRELTRIYATDPGLHRVREDQVAFPDQWLGEERVLVLFPRFRQEDIVRFGLKTKERLPMGITRHTVPNRALRVHYPVRHLRSTAPLAEKRRDLERFLERKWTSGSIRYYPEPTTLYDE